MSTSYVEYKSDALLAPSQYHSFAQAFLRILNVEVCSLHLLHYSDDVGGGDFRSGQYSRPTNPNGDPSVENLRQHVKLPVLHTAAVELTLLLLVQLPGLLHSVALVYTAALAHSYC